MFIKNLDISTIVLVYSGHRNSPEKHHAESKTNIRKSAPSYRTCLY